jgi:hypothetical protein
MGSTGGGVPNGGSIPPGLMQMLLARSAAAGSGMPMGAGMGAPQLGTAGAAQMEGIASVVI